jgi:hypothetical protein
MSFEDRVFRFAASHYEAGPFIKAKMMPRA